MNLQGLKEGVWVKISAEAKGSLLDYKDDLRGKKFEVALVAPEVRNLNLNISLNLGNNNYWWINHKAIECIVSPPTPQEKVLEKIAAMEKRFLKRNK